MTKRMLTPDDVAERLNIQRRTVLTSSLRQQLPWVVVAKRLRLDPDALERFVNRRQGQEV